jgi:O-antigen biosynthesis alpha-1,3-mannosyltransferase
MSDYSTIKIGYDGIQILGNSGIERYTRSTIKHIANDNTNVVVWTSRRELENTTSYFKENPNINVVKGFLHPHTFGKPFRKKVEAYRQNHIWTKRAREVDVIHCTDPMKYPIKPRNVVVMIHDIIPLYRNPDWTNSWHSDRYEEKIQSIKLTARAVLTPSEFVRKELIESCGFAEDKVFAVHEAGYENLFESRNNNNVVGDLGLIERRYWVYIGRIDPRKNFENMFSAFIKTVEQNPDTKLVICGGGSKGTMRRFNERLSKLNLLDNVVFLPGQTDETIQQLLTHALGLIFVSYTEGFGLPIIEAMQCGCPVITSNCSSMPEIAGDSALLVDPSSIDEIHSAMNMLLKSQKLYQDLHSKSIIRAQKFSWSLSAKKTLSVIESIL